MKYIVASDLHGSLVAAEKIFRRFDAEKADKLILLGDLYYHGPRNPLPEGHSPRALYKFLNARKEKILAVRGNCDAEIDLLVSDFPIEDEIRLTFGGKRYFFTHGQNFNKDNFPPDTDVLVYGHFHVDFIEKIGEKWIANPGSVSLPKENSDRAALVLDGKSIVLKDLDGNVLKEAVL